ncbi:hypothetical protein FOA43_001739 [Brettanomyces nanus]|uniref:Major facilitator superfamily (MFS) profile domain-containing protein n=1 Tax=Eeniella nana TaxID=13502 RepID=A0A875RP10_EENNA|nr:uncharacterized protein FOA43_001739 [Brettanomyces nanus]QPG74410.1 hypothetical protein FOA43_001739 [Brettanomyces nanus]
MDTLRELPPAPYENVPAEYLMRQKITIMGYPEVANLDDLKALSLDDENVEPFGLVNSYLPLTLYTVAIASGAMLFGYDIGTVGAIVDMSAFVEKFGDNVTTNPKSFHDLTKGVLIGISSLGGCIGGLGTTQLIPALGPRCTIFIAAVCVCLGNMTILLSEVWFQALGGRLIYGLGNGMVCVACPMFISELAPTRTRGLFISILQLQITIGIITGAITMYVSNSVFGDNRNNFFQYGYPLLQGMALSLVACAVIFMVPESPTWLVSQEQDTDNFEKAKSSVARSRKLPFDHPLVEAYVENLASMTKVITAEEEGKDASVRLQSLRRGQPKYLLRVLTGIALSCFQQGTGINYFFFFGTSIFRTVGSDYQSLLALKGPNYL